MNNGMIFFCETVRRLHIWWVCFHAACFHTQLMVGMFAYPIDGGYVCIPNWWWVCLHTQFWWVWVTLLKVHNRKWVFMKIITFITTQLVGTNNLLRKTTRYLTNKLIPYWSWAALNVLMWHLHLFHFISNLLTL